MQTEDRISLLEAGIENLREDLASRDRRIAALTDMVLFFIAMSDRLVPGPGGAALRLAQDMSRDMKRKKNRQHAHETEALAARLAQMFDPNFPA